MNFDKTVAKDRGIDYIIIEADKLDENTQKEEITVEFISEQWICNDFWLIFNALYFGVSWIAFIFKMGTAESKLDYPTKLASPSLTQKL